MKSPLSESSEPTAVAQKGVRLKGALISCLAATIPLEAVGIKVAGAFLLSPALIIGGLYGLLYSDLRRINRLQVLAAGMLLIFLLTSLPRHSLETYALSLMTLGFVLVPATLRIRQGRDFAALIGGFRFGLICTLGFIAVEIALQVVGLTSIYEEIVGLVRNRTEVIQQHNLFLMYYRPYGLFSEPANLAIYLVAAYAFLDSAGERCSSFRLRCFTAIAVLLTGSISGIILMGSYILFQSLPRITRLAHNQALRLIASATAVMFLGVTADLVFDGALSREIQSLLGRIETTLSALQSAELVGSEGSRVNSYVALTAYWEEAGLPGILWGTGYANYSAWVEHRFADEGALSALARGDVNNMYVAVVLSVGLFGSLAFGTFMYAFLWTHGGRVFSAAGIMLLLIPLFYATMVNYLFWSLALTVLSAQRLSSAER